MSRPTWVRWPEIIASQNEDVTSHSPCLYVGRWDGDDRSWIPEVYDTGIHWDLCSPIKSESVEFIFSEKISHRQYDLWSTVGENSTTWVQVQYPN